MEEKAGSKVREVQIRKKLEILTFLMINQWNKLLWEIDTFKLLMFCTTSCIQTDTTGISTAYRCALY